MYIILLFSEVPMNTETVVLSSERKVTLTAYIQSVGNEFPNISKRPAVIVLPGGGYEYCSEREAVPVALPYLAEGFNAFILRYSVGKYKTWPRPLEDYEEAVEHIRSNSDKYHIDPDKLAVIGFSAGGHLAAAAASMSKNRPNAAILGYAVSGPDVIGCSFTAPDAIAAVDDKTCPCFVFATRNDNIVAVINSVKMMEALTEHGISYEGHIYAYGPHGFTTGSESTIKNFEDKRCSRISDWVDDSIEWLFDIFGRFDEKGIAEPACPPRDNADDGEMLSGECTIRQIMSVPKGRALLNEVSAQIEASSEMEKLPEGIENRFMLVRNLKFIDALRMSGISEEGIQKTLGAIGVIPNKVK